MKSSPQLYPSLARMLLRRLFPWRVSVAAEGEEVFIWLIILAVIVALVIAAIAAILYIGVIILALIAGAGIIVGIFQACWNFFAVLGEAHQKVSKAASGATPSPRGQPASKLYPFDRGWRVISYVRTYVWTRTAASSKWWFDKASSSSRSAKYEDNTVKKYWAYCAAAGFGLGGASQYASSMAFVAVFFAIQTVLLSLWAGLALIPIGLLTAGTWLFARFYRIFYRCPDCHEGMDIPTFICPACGAEHSRLWPSIFGIFAHTCINHGCNTRLPTLDWNGRDKLMRVCANPQCKHPLNVGVGSGTNIHVPIIGGRSAGKTNFMVAATSAFIHEYAEPREYSVTFTDMRHQQAFDANQAKLQRGEELDATREVVPQAYNLLIKAPRRLVPYTAYFYDAAGEAYSTATNTDLQTYYKYVHGIIFMIDPFAIPRLRQERGPEIERVRTSLRPSTLDVMTAYANMIRTFESSVGLRQGTLFPHPIAVVVSKVDALDLEHEIGAPAAKALMAQDPRILLEADAINILVRNFLMREGLDNFVRAVELQFQNVKYFSCSALGRLPAATNHQPFTPQRVLDPYVWLLGNAGAVRAIAERCRTMDAAVRTRSAQHSGMLAAQRYYYWDSLRPVDPEGVSLSGNSTLSAV